MRNWEIHDKVRVKGSNLIASNTLVGKQLSFSVMGSGVIVKMQFLYKS